MKAKSNDLCETNLNSEEIRTGFIHLPSGPREVKYSVVDGLAIFEGDIVLGTVAEMETRSKTKGVGITGDQFRWPNGVIPFTIDSSLPNQQRVTDAISHWENRTFIRFVRRTTETNYVTFRLSDSCSSRIGMQGGEQFINLGNDCSTGNVIHEIGHTVGLFHEQSREDRNNFVRINWANIETGKEGNFNQEIPVSDDYGPYDYGSIMHYGTHFFSKNNLPTIEPLTPGVTIGQRNGLSDGDVATVNMMYGRMTESQIATVSRFTDHLDVFWIGKNGEVSSTWWDKNLNNGRWFSPFNIAPAGSAQQGAVATVSRFADHLDVFWIGKNGEVMSTWWDKNLNNGRWFSPFSIAPAGSTREFSELAREQKK
ncbi:M12 family metallopeptidase [Bacillus thuringiensis]|uniref:M12 family metallopeptidase n=1 Tax=Bacillus thuringiensis TaxID=1428 RepID=UPI0008BF61E5|nr:M12 family metallopeptidase [Bacillus thuringiensis]SEJ42817.1 Astacin (Peptidase family M12A) [Bacillus thuringiensis]